MTEHAFEREIKAVRPSALKLLYRYSINPEDAEDLLQKTSIKLWKNLEKFRQECSFKSYFLRFLSNIILDFYRYNRKRPLCVADLEFFEGTSFEEDKKAEEAFNYLVMNVSINNEDPLIPLLKIELSDTELAEEFNIPIGTIKSRKNRLRDNLIKDMGKEVVLLN